VNKAQKILTLVFLGVFVATLIWFPWKPDSYYFVLLNFGQRPDWFKIIMEWIALAVIYAGLLAVLKTRAK
jgi:hypothetical protein